MTTVAENDKRIKIGNEGVVFMIEGKTAIDRHAPNNAVKRVSISTAYILARLSVIDQVAPAESAAATSPPSAMQILRSCPGFGRPLM